MMIRTTVPALIALAAAGTAAAGDPPARALIDTPLERVWDVPLGQPVHAGWWNAQTPESVQFQVKESNAIYSIEATSGLTRWVSQPLPQPIKANHAPTSSRYVYRKEGGIDLFDDRQWIVSEDRLFSFDGASGHLVWSWQLPFSPSTGFVGQGRGESLRVAAGDWEGRTRVLTYHEEKSLPYQAWQVNHEVSITALPVISDGLIYVTDHAGVVTAYKDGREKVFSRDIGGPIHGSVLTRDRVLYVGNDDNILFALNRLSGETLGQIPLDGMIRRAPFAYHGEPERVYVWIHHEDPARRGLQAVRAQPDRVPFTERHGRTPTMADDRTPAPLDVARLGREWFVAGVESVVGSTAEHLFVLREGSKLVHALNRRKGTYDWTWNPAEVIPSASGNPEQVMLVPYQDPTDGVRSIFVVGGDGHLVCVRLQGFKLTEQRKSAEDRVNDLLRERKAQDAATTKP